jgi:16S rRNA (uracil1498-N3)-methyltransferase
MYIFYTPGIAGNRHTLNPEESAHCSRVLRLRKDDEVLLVDGNGGYYKACIVQPDAKACLLEIIDAQLEFGKRPYSLTMAIGLIKHTDRFEWFIEKATEIGIDNIVPLQCQRSEKKHITHDRLERIAISAMKQSIKAYKPTISPLITCTNFLKQEQSGQRFIAWCDGNDRKLLSHACKAKQNVVILIGPEGDFTPEEVSLAMQHGYTPVSLGLSRLRTETAGMVACSIVSVINEQ